MFTLVSQRINKLINSIPSSINPELSILKKLYRWTLVIPNNRTINAIEDIKAPIQSKLNFSLRVLLSDLRRKNPDKNAIIETNEVEKNIDRQPN